jgi:hypothetical protein
MSDMVEYVKKLTDDMINLRQRQKNAEQYIAQFRQSSEKSVEAMLEQLYDLRRHKDRLDA